MIETPLEKPKGARRILSWLAPGPSCRSVRLDELGESVFRDCDGRKTVREIILRFADEHRLTFLESKALIVLFLKKLMERGAIEALLREHNERN